MSDEHVTLPTCNATDAVYVLRREVEAAWNGMLRASQPARMLLPPLVLTDPVHVPTDLRTETLRALRAEHARLIAERDRCVRRWDGRGLDRTIRRLRDVTTAILREEAGL